MASTTKNYLKLNDLINLMRTYCTDMTICSFHVGLQPSTVDVRTVLSLNEAKMNGRTLTGRCTGNENDKKSMINVIKFSVPNDK